MGKMINLEKFAGGALAEKFNIGLREVLENIADINTPYKTKRKLTVELTFVTSEDRELSIVDINTKTTLAPQTGVTTKVLIDRDGKGGIVASEYNNQLKGQIYLTVDEETGEIIEPDKNIDIAGIKLVK